MRLSWQDPASTRVTHRRIAQDAGLMHGRGGVAREVSAFRLSLPNATPTSATVSAATMHVPFMNPSTSIAHISPAC